MGALEIGISALSLANVALLVTVAIAKSSESEWRQIARVRSESIEQYQREARELKNQIERLDEVVDVLRKTDER
jgi:uncharacterized protein YlxW (UPF0749 family)